MEERCTVRRKILSYKIQGERKLISQIRDVKLKEVNSDGRCKVGREM